MNSKAIKRQLLAAIAMVLVAALALGSSTYAWFVQAGSVTAEGMQVNLTSSGGLVIRYVGAGDGWGVTANANLPTANLLPTSTKDMLTWTYAQAQLAGAYDMDDATYQNVTSDVVGESGAFIADNDYVQMAEFQIRSSNDTIVANGLTISEVTVTKGTGGNAAQDISNSLKVGVRWSYKPNASADAVTGSLVMSPLAIGDNGQTTSYTFVNPGTSTGVGKYVTLGAEETVSIKTPGSNAVVLGTDVPISFSTTYPVTVQIYVWYEGQDTHLYSDNVHDNEDLKISVEFSSQFGDLSAGGTGA